MAAMMDRCWIYYFDGGYRRCATCVKAKSARWRKERAAA